MFNVIVHNIVAYIRQLQIILFILFFSAIYLTFVGMQIKPRKARHDTTCTYCVYNNHLFSVGAIVNMDDTYYRCDYLDWALYVR